jgi:hypothetical protein
MTAVIREIGPEEYARYAEVDPSFEVRSILRIIPVERGLVVCGSSRSLSPSRNRKGRTIPTIRRHPGPQAGRRVRSRPSWPRRARRSSVARQS